MDRNAILKSCRAEFLRVFNELIESAVHRSVEGLYTKAEKTLNSQVQRQFMDARTFMSLNQKLLVNQTINNIETLLDRSFQTAYDSFRPSFFKTAKEQPIALMDINAFEDDLRIDVLTSRFRTEGGERLRDLNIQIAILFERNDVIERENPFRPYLITRAIMLGVESVKPEQDLLIIISDQIAEQLVPKTIKLYEVVNAHLSEYGIGTELQFKKPEKPAKSADSANASDDDDVDDHNATMPSNPGAASARGKGFSQGGNQAPMQNARHGSQFVNPGPQSAPPSRMGKIERLINVVKNRFQQNMQPGSQGNSEGMPGQSFGGSGSMAGGSGHGMQGMHPAPGGFNGGGGFGGGASGGFAQFAGGGSGFSGGSAGFSGGGGFGGGGFGGGGFGGGGSATFGGGHGNGGQAESGSGGAAGLLNQVSSSGGSSAGGWLGGAQAVGQALRRVFFGGGQDSNDSGTGFESSSSEYVSGQVDGDGGADGSADGESDLSPISPQLNLALQSKVPQARDMFGVDGEVRNLIIERRDSLNALTPDQREKMTIDIVAMLFEFILKDTQVPAEVRAQLGRLQFAVLKMALADAALLTKKNHPTRLLVNRIGSISIGLQQVDPSGERISGEIFQIVENLLKNDTENPELFSKMLDQLDEFIAKELAAANSNIELAVNAVTNAEQRMVRLDITSATLTEMLDALTISPYVRQFLLETWARVIERVEHNSMEDSKRFRLLVPNLLWSILPKATHEDRCLLLQIIPTLIPVLREGVDLIGWKPDQQQELLNWFVDAHTAVMRPAVGIETTISLADVQLHFHDFVNVSEVVDEVVFGATPGKKMDIERSILKDVIKEMEVELDINTQGLLLDLDLNSELLASEELAEDVHALQSTDESGGQASESIPLGGGAVAISDNGEAEILDRLRAGVVVELNLSGNPTTGRLNWISPNSSNLILTISGQETPSVISVRMFRRMLKNSLAKFVEVAPLFERAVQTLLESADIVDMEHAA